MSWIPAAIGLATSLLSPRAKVKRTKGQIIGEEAADRILGIDTNTDWEADINRYYDAALRIAKDTFKKTLEIRDAQYSTAAGGNPYLAGADTNTALQNASFGQALIAPNELARASEMLKIPEKRAGILGSASQSASSINGMENDRRDREAQLQSQQNQMWGNVAQIASSMFAQPGAGPRAGDGARATRSGGSGGMNNGAAGMWVNAGPAGMVFVPNMQGFGTTGGAYA